MKVSYNTWHLVRFEVDSENMTVTFFIDKENVGKYVPQDTNKLNNAEYLLILNGISSNDGSLTGSYDYVQLKNK